jgi:hypothetical protein
MSANIARFNQIQSEWMALPANAPESEQRRVLALMAEIPRSHISIDAETGEATPMWQGQPMSIPMPLQDCKRLHPSLAALGFAWRAPEWVTL